MPCSLCCSAACTSFSSAWWLVAPRQALACQPLRPRSCSTCPLHSHCFKSFCQPASWCTTSPKLFSASCNRDTSLVASMEKMASAVRLKPPAHPRAKWARMTLSPASRRTNNRKHPLPFRARGLPRARTVPHQAVGRVARFHPASETSNASR